MDFLLLAKNNVANLDRMLERLIHEWKWVVEVERDGKKHYRKTSRGDAFQKVLKEHGDFEELIEELSKDRLSSDTARGTEQFR